MKPIVYLDMLFLLNFLMDSVIIYTAGFFIKRSLSIPRMILSAGVSALYSSVMFFPQISFLYSVFFKIIFLTFSAWLAFPVKTLKELFKNTVLFFVVSLIFGGMVFALIFATDFGTATGSVVSNGEIYINLTPSVLTSSIILAYLVTYFTSYIKKQNIKQSKIITDAVIFFGSKSITVKALCDTGCHLRDPIHGYPAMVVSPECLKNIIPESFFSSLVSGENIPTEFTNRYRIIPFSTIDNKSGIMHGFVPDRVCINSNEIIDTVIAISKTAFGKNSAFSAILNPELLGGNTKFQETERQENLC